MAIHRKWLFRIGLIAALLAANYYVEDIARLFVKVTKPVRGEERQVP